MKSLLMYLVYLFTLLIWVPMVLAATDYWADSKIVGLGAEQDENFGAPVSLDGNRLVVGAYGPPLTYFSGAAYIYDYNGTSWLEKARLVADNGEPMDYFGTAVSVSGNRVAVGADGDDDLGDGSGAVYIFEYDGVDWVQTAKLHADDGGWRRYFGGAVDLEGDRLLVGSFWDAWLDDNSSAYVFDYDGANWVQSAKLLRDDGPKADGFGESVSLSGNRAAVGAVYDFNQQGSAYVFEYNGTDWVQAAKLQPTDIGYFFGGSVSISGDRLIVGVSADDDLGTDSGSVYVFEYDGADWVKTTKLLAADGAAGDWFGSDVALSGNQIVIGAGGNDDLGDRSGSVYVFDYDGISWHETAKLLAADGGQMDQLGLAVSLSGQRLVAGGEYAGAIYPFRALELADPLADIKVNGVDGPVEVSGTQEITLSARIISGETTGDADWWLIADTPLGWYSYVATTQTWEPYIAVAGQGPIGNRMEQPFIGTTDQLPMGNYDILIYGGVDMIPNGVLDEPIYLDILELSINAP